MRALPVLLLVLASCASSTATTTARPGGPRGPRASDHLAQAVDEDAAASEARSWPDRRVSFGPQATGGLSVPWFRSYDAAAEHDRLAAQHRGDAAAIYAAYEEACGTAPSDAVSHSPLQRFGLGGWNTSNGVVVYLSANAGSADDLVRLLRCHRAWMMLAPANMDDCPLDLPGLQIDARGDGQGITLVLGVRDAKLVGELQRRTALDLEGAARHHP